LIIQIINLTPQDVFKSYSEFYNIYRDVYQHGLLGLEIRDIPQKLAKAVQKIVLNEKQICYKKDADKEDETLNLFIPGSLPDFSALSRKVLSLGDEDLGYKILNVVKNYGEYDSGSFRAGGRNFPLCSSYVMGILNVTPDSFSDGGLYYNTDEAAAHGLRMLENGADILDIGGESTRPGSYPVSIEEEIKRVIPVVKKIIEAKSSAVISIDTTKSEVAEQALKAGAKIINDISAGEFDPEIFNVVKKHNAAIVLMHMQGTPATMQQNPHYADLIREIYDFLYEKAQKAVKAGIKNIIVDPGVGFGKTVEHNFEIIRRIGDFKSLGFPVLIGVSRKGFIGKTLGLQADSRDAATAVIEALSIKNGARFIRTHNTELGLQVTKLLNRIS
jgi:dihydropteroate synthase